LDEGSRTVSMDIVKLPPCPQQSMRNLILIATMVRLPKQNSQLLRPLSSDAEKEATKRWRDLKILLEKTGL